MLEVFSQYNHAWMASHLDRGRAVDNFQTRLNMKRYYQGASITAIGDTDHMR